MMNTQLCSCCGKNTPVSESSRCSECTETLRDPQEFNGLCEGGTECYRQVEFFCVCGLKPVVLCLQHRDVHTADQLPHLVCDIAAYNYLANKGFPAFQQNYRDAVTAALLISREQQRLSSFQASFDSQLTELRAQMAKLENYSSSLQRKQERLEQLRTEVMKTHPRRLVREILEQGLECQVRKELGESLALFCGPEMQVDVETAVAAMELRQGMHAKVPQSLSGLEKLNVAVGLRTNPINPVSPKASMCFLSNSHLLVSGGDDVKSAFTLVPGSSQRTPLPDMRQARGCHGIVEYRSAVYIFGGLVDTSISVKSWECLKPAAVTWEIEDMRHGRQFFNPGVYKDKIYLAGGHCEEVAEVFDPTTRSFEKIRKGPAFTNGGVVLGFDHELVILFDTKVYRHEREKKIVRQKFPLGETGMFSIVTPIRDEQGVVFLLLSDNRKLRVEMDRNMEPDITTYP